MNEFKSCAIITRNVCFDYNHQSKKLASKSMVLNNVNISVAKGEIYGLLGPSGCGKTTLLKIVIGLLQSNSGDVNVFGFKPGTKESGVPGIGVGYMPQEISLPLLFNVREVFKYFGSIYLLQDDYIEKQMNYFLKIFDLKDKKEKICNLSGGQKRRVSLAIALFSSPRLLILDEPTVGVDPLLRQKIWLFLTNLTQKLNKTIIVTTHYIEEMRCANKVAFMREGEILAEDEPNNIIERSGCINLEDVFIKLCNEQKSSERNEKFENENKAIKEPLIDERCGNSFIINMKIMKAIIWKIWKTYLRHGGAPFTFILPIIASILLINCIGIYPKDVRLGFIVDDELIDKNYLNSSNDETPFLPNLLLHRLIESKTFIVVKYNKINNALKDAKNLKIIGFIYLKKNFSDSFYERDLLLNNDGEDVSNETIDAGTVHFSCDMTIRPLYQFYESQLLDLIQKFREDAFEAIGVNRNASLYPFQLGDAIHGSSERENYSQHTHNSVIAFYVASYFGFSVAATAVTLLLDINDEIYSRSFSAGVKPYLIILGEIFTQFILMGSSAITTLLIIVIGFDVPCKGSILFIVINILLQTLSGLTLGAMISVVLKTPFNCHLFIYAIFIEATMVSDAMWPTITAPYFIKILLPFTPCYFQILAMLNLFNYPNYNFLNLFFASIANSICYAIISCVIACFAIQKTK